MVFVSLHAYGIFGVYVISNYYNQNATIQLRKQCALKAIGTHLSMNFMYFIFPFAISTQITYLLKEKIGIHTDHCSGSTNTAMEVWIVSIETLVNDSSAYLLQEKQSEFMSPIDYRKSMQIQRRGNSLQNTFFMTEWICFARVCGNYTLVNFMDLKGL